MLGKLPKMAYVEAQELVRSLAPPNMRSVKGCITHLARKLKWSPRRVESAWYGEPTARFRSEEIDQLRRLKSEALEGVAANEIERLHERIAALEEIIRRARL